MTEKPDFSEFEDWFVGGAAGVWPDTWDDKPLSATQRKIVERNAALLLKRNEWSKKVEKFESQISKVPEFRKAEVRRRFTIQFQKHEFDAGQLDLSFYKFPCAVSFNRTVFGKGDVTFVGAVFTGGDTCLDLNAARFEDGDVSFYNADFVEGNVFAIGTKFGKGEVDFGEANFRNGNVWFMPFSAQFSKLSFAGSNVVGGIFVSGKLPGNCTFQRLTVGGTAGFEKADFQQTPDFRHAKFDRPPEVAGMQVPEPEMEGRWPFDTAENKEDAPKLRKLKAMALDAHDHSRDGYFFAIEMRAKRGVETKGFWPLLLDTAYRQLSNYGQSIVRPLFGFATSIYLFAFIYSLCIPTNALPWQQIRGVALENSLRNFVPALNSLLRFTPIPVEYKSGFQHIMSNIAALPGNPLDTLIWLSVIQQAIGAILLFLLLLGLRNKFRMK